MVLFSTFLLSAADTQAASREAGDSVDYIVLGMGCFWGAEKRMAAITGMLYVESGDANCEVAGTYEPRKKPCALDVTAGATMPK